MDVRVTSDPAAFRRTVFPFLQRDPVLHTIIMTNVHRRATAPAEQQPGYYVSVREGDGDVVGAAMRTPGRGVYLGALRPEYAEAVADAYLDVLPELGGVAGDRPAVESFAARWSARRGVTGTETRATRLHKLSTLTPLSAPGSARLMKDGEVELVARWARDGFPEELGDPDWAGQQLAGESLWIWEIDSEPVSMAGHHPPVFGACRVGPVYTPPEHRRHGYAGALTSHVTATILAAGNQACLYTDLANPTSNKIYFDAGYRPLADFIDIEFTPR
ncbi:acetyltransferase [Kribbella turkmenica]|uniref:Acetyltransferase n=1 Tax=Kribbella turkmenica TaxID=2530375 RepID=A0A4R4X078_9ACTN|nr:GNAT family N-acetyltransferase [Kribbella turkmenica]TDD23442.1 acetyltransferase [Kribbella turkmenica]